MNKYFILNALPVNADQVAVLLDANVTKPHFCRSNTDLWYDAIKTRALTRVPVYGKSYRIYADFNYNREGEFVIHAKLVSRGSEIGGKISWIPGNNLGKNQLNHAIDGATFMTFEKAVVCIFALNSLIVEDIEKYEQDRTQLAVELDAIEQSTNSKSDDTAPDVDIRSRDRSQNIKSQLESLDQKMRQLTSALIGEHSVIISCFYFYNIGPVIKAAIDSGQYNSLQSLANKVAEETNQSVNFVKNMLGNVELNSPFHNKIDRAVKHVASYPTMRAIFKTLLGIKACKEVIGTTNREDYIQRIHVGIGNKTTVQDERMISPQKITRPPYDWGLPDKGAELYPPGFEDNESSST